MMKTRMNTRLKLSSLTLSLIAGLVLATLPACQKKDNSPTNSPVVSPKGLADFVTNSSRLESDVARDSFRNPQETLEFFGIKPDMTVIEIWPSSYYSDIIAPYLASERLEDGTPRGHYVAAQIPLGIAPFLDKRVKDQKVQFANNDIYGRVSFTTLSDQSLDIWPTGDADMVLTFRNVHNWMGRGYAQEAFDAFYKALKPGGILGVVEHRLPETRTQDPLSANGYVQTSYMKNLAANAGFEFVAGSEINANPKDTADHPYGVWTLPPRSKGPEDGEEAPEGFDPAQYLLIGESDRATLKFRKPL